MNAERLLEVYEQISEAPDAIARLRRFVLDLAVRGKLVDQDPTNAPASALIREAKALKVREGVKEKPDPIEGSDIPFPVPVGWHWTRVGTIALQTGSGSTPRGGKSAYADKGTPFLRSQNIYDEGLRLDDVVFINDETNANMKRTQVKAKDLLLNITGGSIGRCTRVPDDFLGANVSQHVAIIRTAATGTEDYLHLLVKSPFFQEYVIGEQTGAGRGGRPKNRMDRIPVPLPPLAEQHRIVAKVDELMTLCDRLEEARKTREETRDKLTAASLARLTAPDTTSEDFLTHANFAVEALPALTTRPDQIKTLRQTILNLAVRGKLVEQDPADEPASELLERIEQKKLETIQETGMRKPRKVADMDPSETWADLPENWAWTQISKLGFISPRNEADDDTKASFVPMPMIFAEYGVANSHEPRTWGEIKKGYTHFAEGDVGLAKITPCFENGKSTVFRDLTGGFGSGTTELHVLRPVLVKPDYVVLFLKSPQFIEAGIPKMTGTAGQKRVSSEYFTSSPFPLPPLAEQHRILAKVDALMALCDRLEAALTTTDTTRTRLLEALLHEALEPSQNVMEAAE